MLESDPTTLLVTLAAVLGCCYYVLVLRRNESHKKLPPCPARPWPLVGNIFHMSSENPREQFKAWHKQLGNMFSLYFGNTLVIVLNGYSTIKETLVQKGPVFSDRPSMYINDVIGMKGQGVTFTSGSVWKELRSTTKQIFKEFGVGTNILAEKIQEEVECYVDRLAQLKGKATDIQMFTHVSVSNVICSITLGKRFSHDDPRFQATLKSLVKIAESARGAAAINYLPFLQYIPGDAFKARTLKTNITIIKDLLAEYISLIESSKEAKKGNTRNYIFSYRQKHDEKANAGKATSLDTPNLVKTIVDLFGAGTETVASTIVWCVLYTLHTPGVQTKIHKELDREIGQERPPNMDDKTRLPYLQAVIKESQRLASIVPFSVLHKTSEDVTVGEYFIPKGTSIVPNLDSVLHDPDIWGDDADKFKPDRFLDADGNVIHREELIPFGVGGRLCVGESIAKMELFLFLSSMFQRFEFLLPDPKNPPSLKASIGITSVPQPFQVLCVDRFQRNVQ